MSNSELFIPNPPIADVEVALIPKPSPAPDLVLAYQAQDGTVYTATSREQVIAQCPVIGEMAVKAPEQLNPLFELAELAGVSLVKKEQNIANEEKGTEEVSKNTPGKEKKTKDKVVESLDKKNGEKIDKETKEEPFASANNSIEDFIEVITQKNTVEDEGRLADSDTEHEDILGEDVAEKNIKPLPKPDEAKLAVDDTKNMDNTSYTLDKSVKLEVQEVSEMDNTDVISTHAKSVSDGSINFKTEKYTVDEIIAPQPLVEIPNFSSIKQATQRRLQTEKIDQEVILIANEIVSSSPQPVEQHPTSHLNISPTEETIPPVLEAERNVALPTLAEEIHGEENVSEIKTSGASFQQDIEADFYQEYFRPSGASQELPSQKTQQFAELTSSSFEEQEGSEQEPSEVVFAHNGAESEETTADEPSEPERSDEIEGRRKIQLRTFESSIKIDMVGMDLEKAESNTQLLIFILELAPLLRADQEGNEAVGEGLKNTFPTDASEDENERIEDFFTHFSLYLLSEITDPDKSSNEQDSAESMYRQPADADEQTEIQAIDQIITPDMAIFSKPSFENEENMRDIEPMLVPPFDRVFVDQTMDLTEENILDADIVAFNKNKAPGGIVFEADQTREIPEISFTTEEIEYVCEELNLLSSEPEMPTSKTPFIENQEENEATFASLVDLKHVIEADMKTPQLAEEVKSFETIQEKASVQPVEQTFVQLTTSYIAEALPKPAEDFFEHIINDIQVELEKAEIYMDSDDQENTPITPQVVENVLILLQYAGYVEPAETLLEFAKDYGTEKLLQLLSDFYDIQKLKKKREAILWSSYKPDDFSLGFETIIPDRYIHAVFLPAA